MELTHTSFKDLCAHCTKQFQSQNWKAARESAREILEQFPDQPHGIAWLTIASWHLGNTDEATTMADEAIKQFPDNAWIWENRAILAGFAQDWALASARWQACIARFPRSPAAYVEGSKAYLQLAEPKKAMKLVDAGLALFPNNWHLLVAQATYYVERSEWETAQDKWLSLCEKFPNNEFVRRKTIDIFHRVQNHVGAFNTVMEWIASSAVKLAILKYINGLYYPYRNHSLLRWKSPMDFEWIAH